MTEPGRALSPRRHAEEPTYAARHSGTQRSAVTRSSSATQASGPGTDMPA